MGARYATTAFQTPVGTSYKTVLEMLGGSTLRFRLYDWLIGSSGTPADNALVHAIFRITASGTGTAVTPQKLDPADVAGVVTMKEDNTGEPTTAGIAVLEIPVNLRASYRWVAAPGSEIVVAAISNQGLATMAKAAAFTGKTEHSVLHEE